MPKDNTRSVKVQEVKPVKIYPGAEVTLIRQGERFAEVLYMMRQPKATIRKLNKDEYVELSTGEVKQFKKSDEKKRSTLRDTFRELKYLIRANFSADDPSQKFVTLTYRENMTDQEQLYRDFGAFWKRLQYHHKTHPMQYIVVAEPQERGAWHMHVMIRSDVPGLWIDKHRLTEIWGHGMTDIEQLKSDDVGNYYVAYFTSLAAELDGGEKDPLSAEKSKAYVKGGRLHFYPRGFRFFRTSRGIKRPTQEQIEYWRVKDEYGKTRQVSAYELHKVDEDGDEELMNHIQRETYKKGGGDGDES